MTCARCGNSPVGTDVIRLANGVIEKSEFTPNLIETRYAAISSDHTPI